MFITQYTFGTLLNNLSLMGFIAQRPMVAIIFHSWCRLSVSVSQYFHVCSLPLLVGEGLLTCRTVPACLWSAHTCHACRSHCNALDKGCRSLLHFLPVYLHSLWTQVKGKVNLTMLEYGEVMERTQHMKGRKTRRTRCERCSWEARARVCPFKQVGWCKICKGLSQSFIIPIKLQQMRHLRK